MKRDEAIALVTQYRKLIDGMQRGIYYAQDRDGCLRRWYPPTRPLLDQDSGDKG